MHFHETVLKITNHETSCPAQIFYNPFTADRGGYNVNAYILSFSVFTILK